MSQTVTHQAIPTTTLLFWQELANDLSESLNPVINSRLKEQLAALSNQITGALTFAPEVEIDRHDR